MVRDVQRVVGALSALRARGPRRIMRSAEVLAGRSQWGYMPPRWTTGIAAVAVDLRRFAAMRLGRARRRDRRGLKALHTPAPHVAAPGFLWGTSHGCPFDTTRSWRIAPRPVLILAPTLDQDWVRGDRGGMAKPRREHGYALYGGRNRIRYVAPVDFKPLPAELPEPGSRLASRLWPACRRVDSAAVCRALLRGGRCVGLTRSDPNNRAAVLWRPSWSAPVWRMPYFEQGGPSSGIPLVLVARGRDSPADSLRASWTCFQRRSRVPSSHVCGDTADCQST